MKKTLFVLISAIIFLAFPSAAQAQTGDSVNLYIQLLDQKASSDSVTCISLRSFATGEITQQMLDSSFQAAFKAYPLQQFSMEVRNSSEQSAPSLPVTLYRGAKTEILHADQNAAEISVANSAKQLTLALVLDESGSFKLYTVTDKSIKAFSSLPAFKDDATPNQVDVKFYFQDMWGTSGNGLVLKMDAGDLHPSNLDGEIYLSSVAMGTHKLIASSKNGVKLAESYISLSRATDTVLSVSNQTNPMITVAAGQQAVYVLADVQSNLVKMRQAAPNPLAPGARPELSDVSLQGCLVDSSQKPVPQVELSMGDYSSITDDSGVFEMSELPVDQYQLVAKDSSGKKLASLALLMEKDFSTGIKDVTLNSASVGIAPSTANLFMTLQLMDDNALMLREVSEKQLSVSASAPPASPSAAQATPANAAASGRNSLLTVYIFLLIIILALVVVVTVVLLRLHRTSKPRH